MVKQHDDIITRPLPSAATPWLVILCLLAGIALMYLGFLRPADRLLGAPLHRNEYRQYMTPPKAQPAPVPALPSAATPPAGSSAMSTPLAPEAAPAEPPLDNQRVIGE